jgi:hypothetical protein
MAVAEFDLFLEFYPAVMEFDLMIDLDPSVDLDRQTVSLDPDLGRQTVSLDLDLDRQTDSARAASALFSICLQ